jgi:hypothetical protein
LSASIGITSKLAAEQRPALEQLLFFNVNQHRVDPGLSLTSDQSTRVLLKLMHEIRSTARRTRGVDCIELAYKVRHAVRLHV